MDKLYSPRLKPPAMPPKLKFLRPSQAVSSPSFTLARAVSAKRNDFTSLKNQDYIPNFVTEKQLKQTDSY